MSITHDQGVYGGYSYSVESQSPHHYSTIINGSVIAISKSLEVAYRYLDVYFQNQKL
jgi:hypothetical protein